MHGTAVPCILVSIFEGRDRKYKKDGDIRLLSLMCRKTFTTSCYDSEYKFDGIPFPCPCRYPDVLPSFIWGVHL